MIFEIQSAFQEFWDSFLAKVPSILIGLIFLLLFIVGGVVLRKFLKRRLIGRISDRLLVNFIGRMVFTIFLVVGFIIFLNQVGLGKAAGGLLAGAGVSALILGFAFKDIGENFLAGFFLAFSRPFSIGDIIEVSENHGRVKSLSFRNTHIRTFDGKDIFMPNAMLIKNPLINYTRDGLLRHDFVVGIAYEDDIKEVVQLIMEVLQDEPLIEHGDELKPFIQLDKFDTSTVNIRIFYWINSIDFIGSSTAILKTSVMEKVVSAILTNGYSLPADIKELKIYQEGRPIPVQVNQQDR